MIMPPPCRRFPRLLHLRLWNSLLAIIVLSARDAVTFTFAVNPAVVFRGGTTPTPQRSPKQTRQSWLSLGSTQTDNDQHTNNNNNNISELPSNIPRREHVLTMIAAVRQACAITVALQPVDRDALETAVSKQDLSPVTVADFAVQASILQTLQQQADQQQQQDDDCVCGFIAEEDSAALRDDSALCQAVALACAHGGNCIMSIDQVVAAIDLGKSYQQWDDDKNPRPKRVYCLDPIDGTRGFLRGRKPGGQYAIALALLEDGVPVIGVLGCPNLPRNDNYDHDVAWKPDETLDNNISTRGCIFVAVQGGGCYQLPLKKDDESRTAPSRRLHVTPQPPSTTEAGSGNKENKLLSTGRFCIGVEKYSDAKGQTVEMARYIQGPDAVTADGVIVQAQRMDSQAKHGVIARGGAEWYVRLPKPGYQEWIWDHAAGYVVATEAGGTMTDTAGQPLDFSLGAKLAPDVKGVLMSSGGIWHEALVEAYAAVDAIEKEETGQL